MIGSLLLAARGAHADDTRTLADLPASTRTAPWIVVNDNVMGGRSKGDFRLTAGSLVFSGSTNTRGGGFSSLRSRMPAADLSDFDGVRLRVRGDGRRYTFRLTTSTAKWRGRVPSYWADFPTRGGEDWEEIDVPFTKFRPRWRGRNLDGPRLDLETIDSLGLMIYDKLDGPFRLEVDWVRAYRSAGAFSLSTYRWAKRPLLIFAERASDTRLERQLDAVRAARAGFDERDMMLVVVLAEGDSTFEGKTMRREDAARLRAAYKSERDAFAVRLVGKDGGVKRTARDVVSMRELYDLIDVMPMRRAEIERRDR